MGAHEDATQRVGLSGAFVESVSNALDGGIVPPGRSCFTDRDRGKVDAGDITESGKRCYTNKNDIVGKSEKNSTCHSVDKIETASSITVGTHSEYIDPNLPRRFGLGFPEGKPYTATPISGRSSGGPRSQYSEWHVIGPLSMSQAAAPGGFCLYRGPRTTRRPPTTTVHCWGQSVGETPVQCRGAYEGFLGG